MMLLRNVCIETKMCPFSFTMNGLWGTISRELAVKRVQTWHMLIRVDFLERGKRHTFVKVSNNLFFISGTEFCQLFIYICVILGAICLPIIIILACCAFFRRRRNGKGDGHQGNGEECIRLVFLRETYDIFVLIDRSKWWYIWYYHYSCILSDIN